MPTWSHEPPPFPKHMGFSLIRTPPDRPLTAIVTSDDLVGCNTHYWGGRTVPCEYPDCRACNAAMPYRWHAYLAAFDPRTKDHFLFECTALAAVAFRDYRLANGTLRGCHFQAVRPKRGKNAKVEIVTKPADLSRINLPQPPDMQRAMSVIWQLPATALPSTPGLDGRPQVRPVNRIIDQMRGEAPDDAEPLTVSEILAGNGKSR